ncbi:MAG: hypothetical protein EZS28_021475 [Streblomastix strix]|uniref:Uncharacterized protein n=1 Tax=Streblomastix strix TaxID=222440 RepID=A0A5J4VK73_9EUKA|nr:MAG: hypothetical protein EZS28_021475 [Streblomastix strix]
MKCSLLDGINKNLQAQKIVTTLDSYNHTHVGGQEFSPSERYDAIINCMGLLAFNIDNDTNIVTAFLTIKAARTAMTGIKLQYASKELGYTIAYQAHQFFTCGISDLISNSQSSAAILMNLQGQCCKYTLSHLPINAAHT